jgi:hypothetical protein
MHTIFGAPPNQAALAQDGIIYSGLLTPLLETPIVILPAAWMGTIFRSRIILPTILGAIPIISLHGVIGWEKSLAVAPMFLWSVYFYIYRRRMGADAVRACYGVYLMHAVTNTIAMLIIQG